MKKLVANFSLLITAIVVSLFIIEIILRVFGLAPGLTMIPLDDTSSKKIIKGPEFTYYSEVNSLGLRELRNIDKHTKAKRIIFLGDSYTYGVGVSNHETFSYITEGLLNNYSHNSWQIVNISKPSTGTFIQLNLLKDFINKIDIDEVILFYCVYNDRYDTMGEYSASKLNNANNDETISIFDKIAEIKEWCNRHTAIYLFLKFRLWKVGTLRAFPYMVFDQCDPGKIASIAEKDGLTRKLISDFLQNNHIKFSVVLIPMPEQISDEVFDNFKKQYGLSKINYDRFLPQKMLIANVFKPLGIEVIDLMDKLNGKDPGNYYFNFDKHLNKRGNRFVAEIIASKIIAESK